MSMSLSQCHQESILGTHIWEDVVRFLKSLEQTQSTVLDSALLSHLCLFCYEKIPTLSFSSPVQRPSSKILCCAKAQFSLVRVCPHLVSLVCSGCVLAGAVPRSPLGVHKAARPQVTARNARLLRGEDVGTNRVSECCCGGWERREGEIHP